MGHGGFEMFSKPRGCLYECWKAVFKQLALCFECCSLLGFENVSDVDIGKNPAL